MLARSISRVNRMNKDASDGVDWDAERIEIIDLEEENHFRFDAYNAGIRCGSDSEMYATRLNLVEERVLMKDLRKIRIEEVYSVKMHDIKRSLMEQRNNRFRHYTANVKSNLSADEVTRFRRLDLQGRLFPPGSKGLPVTSCGFSSASILANASRRLFGRSASSPRRSRPVSAAPTVSERPEGPSMTETTVRRQVGAKTRPLTAAFPTEADRRRPKSARTQSAPGRGHRGSSGFLTDRGADHEGLDFAAIEELLPRGERLPNGSTEEKIAALRDLMRRSRLAQERARRRRAERKIAELCKVFDSMAVQPEATEVFVPDGALPEAMLGKNGAEPQGK